MAATTWHRFHSPPLHPFFASHRIVFTPPNSRTASTHQVVVSPQKFPPTNELSECMRGCGSAPFPQ
eukprot:117107-Prymnesium_polylepis.1